MYEIESDDRSPNGQEILDKNGCLKIIDQERIGGIPFSPGISSHG